MNGDDAEDAELTPADDARDRFEQFIAMAVELGMESMAIRIEDNACAACRTLILAYPLESVPRLPLETCARAGGCGCSYVPLPRR